jgi:hypothetical protein
MTVCCPFWIGTIQKGQQISEKEWSSNPTRTTDSHVKRIKQSNQKNRQSSKKNKTIQQDNRQSSKKNKTIQTEQQTVI